MARKKDYKSVNGENPELLESLVGNGENTDRPPLQTMGISRNLYNVLVMAFSFLMLFVAFQVIFPHFPHLSFIVSPLKPPPFNVARPAVGVANRCKLQRPCFWLR